MRWYHSTTESIQSLCLRIKSMVVLIVWMIELIDFLCCESNSLQILDLDGIPFKWSCFGISKDVIWMRMKWMINTISMAYIDAHWCGCMNGYHGFIIVCSIQVKYDTLWFVLTLSTVIRWYNRLLTNFHEYMTTLFFYYIEYTKIYIKYINLVLKSTLLFPRLVVKQQSKWNWIKQWLWNIYICIILISNKGARLFVYFSSTMKIFALNVSHSHMSSIYVSNDV
jgi:hypothetical protein